jgi:hypothetical protein
MRNRIPAELTGPPTSYLEYLINGDKIPQLIILATIMQDERHPAR